MAVTHSNRSSADLSRSRPMAESVDVCGALRRPAADGPALTGTVDDRATAEAL